MSAVKIEIEKLVERLLHHYECVILPDFGGFIIRDSPCNFNVAKDKLKPYAKHIFFNPHLLQNDGLLYNEIQKSCGLSYQESIASYQSWLSGIKEVITEAGSKKFGNLGSFYKGNENSVWFSPLATLNLAMESYGLFPVDIRQVHVDVVQEEAELEKPLIPEAEEILSLADNKPIESPEPVRLNYKGWLVAASVALAAHIGYLSFEKKDVTVNEASVIPVIENTTNPADSAIIADSAPAMETSVDPAVTEEQHAIPGEQTAVQPEAPVTTSPEPAVEPLTQVTPQVSPAQPEQAPADTASKMPGLQRVAKYKLEENANNHRNDLGKKGIRAEVRLNGEWYEVLTEEPIQ